MDNGYVIYSAIKRLLYDYHVEVKDYENFIKDLARILKV